MFVQKESNGMTYWQEENLAQWENIVHAFSQRGKDGKFNLALHVNDEKNTVIANREKFTEALGIKMMQTVTMEQIHGVNINIVGKNEQSLGMYDYDTAIKATDGLITNEPQVALMGCFADCVPLYFYDPVKNVIALSHGGWKGTVGGIARLTVEKMNKEFGCEYKDILAIIGPSIGKCHYEVDSRVIAEVQKMPWWQEVLDMKDNEHGNLDLWQYNHFSLLDVGLKDHNIFISGLCTYCNNDKFFSYRAEKEKSGRMAAIIMMK